MRHPENLIVAIVIAFPGGRGTEDMVRRARKAGVRVEDWGEELTESDQAHAVTCRENGG